MNIHVDLIKCRRVFLHGFLLKNEVQTSGKNTELWFSIKLETTCKNSAHFDEKKKKRPTFNTEWLCPDTFNFTADYVHEFFIYMLWHSRGGEWSFKKVRVSQNFRRFSWVSQSRFFSGCLCLGVSIFLTKLSRSLDFFTSVSFWPFVCCFWLPLWFINNGNLIWKTVFGPFPFGVTKAKTFWQR